MNNLKAAIMALASAISPAYYPDGQTPKARNDGESKRQKTKKGAVHIQGKVFRSRNVLKVAMKKDALSLAPVYSFVTPAEYRRLHLGKVRK